MLTVAVTAGAAFAVPAMAATPAWVATWQASPQPFTAYPNKLCAARI